MKEFGGTEFPLFAFFFQWSRDFFKKSERNNSVEFESKYKNFMDSVRDFIQYNHFMVLHNSPPPTPTSYHRLTLVPIDQFQNVYWFLVPSLCLHLFGIEN